MTQDSQSKIIWKNSILLNSMFLQMKMVVWGGGGGTEMVDWWGATIGAG